MKRRITIEVTDEIDRMLNKAREVSELSTSDIIRQCIKLALPMIYPQVSRKDNRNATETSLKED